MNAAHFIRESSFVWLQRFLLDGDIITRHSMQRTAEFMASPFDTIHEEGEATKVRSPSGGRPLTTGSRGR